MVSRYANDEEEFGLDDISAPSLNFYRDGRFYIGGSFDESIQTNIIPHLFNAVTNVDADGEPQKITFLINSPGGQTKYLKDILGFIDIAKKVDIIVSTIVFGNAYSCGSLLAVSGTKGYRYVGRNAEHLCHLGQAGSISRNEEDAKRLAARTKRHFDFIKDIYRKNAKIPDLDRVIKDDNYFVSGRNLIKFGLADSVIG